MKIFWKQMLVGLLSFSICFQSYGENKCSAVFSVGDYFKSVSFYKKMFIPKAILNFDYDLYWQVRTNDLQNLNLTPQELKSFEVKIGLIDRSIPNSEGAWLNKLPHLGLLRLRELNGLASRFSLKHLQDSYLRQQFITQLYLLNDTPLMGFKKSLEISRREGVQEWVERGLEEYILNYGLEGALQKLGFGNPSSLDKVKTAIKKFFANNWMSFPRKIPVFSKNLNDPLFKEILSETLEFEDPRIVARMQKDHLLDNYNKFTRIYQRAAVIILTILIYSMISEDQEENEKKINDQFKEIENSPENIQKRNEAFEKAMNELKKIDTVVEQMTTSSVGESAYQETLLLFETVNKRKASLEEQQRIRQKIEK